MYLYIEVLCLHFYGEGMLSEVARDHEIVNVLIIKWRIYSVKYYLY